MKFTATRRYRAVYKSTSIGFEKGDQVEVDAETAAWVNNDSPGCLEPAKQASKKAVAKKAAGGD